MSFNTEIKKELGSFYPKKECCQKAVLCAYYAIFGTETTKKLYIKTENSNIARHILLLNKKVLNIDTDIQILHTNKDKTVFNISITNKNDIDTLKNTLKLRYKNTDIFHSTIEPSFTVENCCKKACLQAAFLACGIISSPKKSYRLEFVLKKKQLSEDILDILYETGFEFSISSRKNNYIVYTSSVDEIYRFLSLFNLKKAMIYFHNIISERKLKNDINRQMNFESANEDKRIEASILQIAAINKLIQNKKFAELPIDLQKTAKLRLENPDLSLNELSKLKECTISKSGLNHRLTKLIKLSQIE